MNEILMYVLLSIIGLLGIMTVSYAIPLIKSKTTNEQRKNIEYWTNVAIQAIEDYYKNNPGQGVTKKEFVIKFVKGLGFGITDEQIDVLIDAIVKQMNEIKKEYIE